MDVTSISSVRIQAQQFHRPNSWKWADGVWCCPLVNQSEYTQNGTDGQTNTPHCNR